MKLCLLRHTRTGADGAQYIGVGVRTARPIKSGHSVPKIGLFFRAILSMAYGTMWVKKRLSGPAGRVSLLSIFCQPGRHEQCFLRDRQASEHSWDDARLVPTSEWMEVEEGGWEPTSLFFSLLHEAGTGRSPVRRTRRERPVWNMRIYAD